MLLRTRLDLGNLIHLGSELSREEGSELDAPGDTAQQDTISPPDGTV